VNAPPNPPPEPPDVAVPRRRDSAAQFPSRVGGGSFLGVMRTFTFLLLMAVAVVFTGCVACELRLTNHTGGSIQFYTGNTKKAVQIPAGATRTIPHAAGGVIIITQQDEVWGYDAVDVPDFTTETLKGFQRLTLPLTVEPSGVVTFRSGRKIEPSRKMNSGR